MEQTATVDKKRSAALKDAIIYTAPIVVAFIPVGFAFGVLATKAGLSPLLTALMSFMVLAGSSQFIAVGMIASGVGVTAIIITTFIVNLRHMLMSASIAPWLKTWSKKRTMLFSFVILDETFPLHMDRFIEGDTRKDVSLYINTIAHSAWVGSSLFGALCGNLISDVRPAGLDYTLIAMFFALLIPQVKRSFPHLFAAIAAAASATAMQMAGGTQWNVILATIIGATAAQGVQVWMRKRSS
ncbi:MAG: AzlC family ABC transporter permease [Desulfovibrio sp.]